MSTFLYQIVLIPLVASPITYLAGRKLAHKTGWVAFTFLLYTTALAFLALFSIRDGMALVETYGWAQELGLSIGLRADGLSLPFVLTICILSAAISIYSIPYMKHRVGSSSREYGAYFALYLLYSAGMLGAILSTNLVEFYLFYELMLIPSYFLIAQWGYGERERIALMYFLWTHIGALALLVGIASTYTFTHSFDIYAIPSIIAGEQVSLEFLKWVSLAMFLGFFTKMAVFGLHIWLPHAHAEAPTPISALLSPAMIGIGGYATVRITFTFFPDVFEALSVYLAFWALVTIIYGGMMALAQDDIKRLLAYSSISQMGYILFGISSQNALGMSGSMFHYVSHGLGKGLLFMVAGAIILQTNGLRSIKKMGGLASKMPITTLSAIIGFMTIMGAPPLSGFQSKWMLFTGVFQNALEHGSLTSLLMALLGMAATSLTVGYGIWTIKRVFFGQRLENLENVKEAPLTITLPLLALTLITVFLGIYPEVITNLLVPTLRSFIP